MPNFLFPSHSSPYLSGPIDYNFVKRLANQSTDVQLPINLMDSISSHNVNEIQPANLQNLLEASLAGEFLDTINNILNRITTQSVGRPVITAIANENSQNKNHVQEIINYLIHQLRSHPLHYSDLTML